MKLRIVREGHDDQYIVSMADVILVSQLHDLIIKEIHVKQSTNSDCRKIYLTSRWCTVQRPRSITATFRKFNHKIDPSYSSNSQ